MEKEEYDQLLEDGRKNLEDLKVTLGKLAETALKVATNKAGELEAMANDAKDKVQQAAGSDEMKQLEEKGRQAIVETETAINAAAEKLAETARLIAERFGHSVTKKSD
ncbi:MAG: hypothetical protein U0T84_09345 [Chitinophagales bacterium]